MRMGIFWLSTILAATGLYIGTERLNALNIPDSKHYIEFVASGTPHFLRIVGKSENNCMGFVRKESGKIQCRLDALKTGIALRDKHMLNYLDAGSHPMVSLTFKAKDDKFNGILELKGRRVPVSGTYNSEPLKFDFIIDIYDYGIAAPKYLGIGIDPDIHITAGLQ